MTSRGARGRVAERRVLATGLPLALVACLALFAIHVPGWHVHAQADEAGRCVTCRTVASVALDLPLPTLTLEPPRPVGCDLLARGPVEPGSAWSPTSPAPRGPPTAES